MYIVTFLLLTSREILFGPPIFLGWRRHRNDLATKFYEQKIEKNNCILDFAHGINDVIFRII